jgi:putative transposase
MDWRIRSHRRQASNQPGHAHEPTFSCYHGYAFLSADRTCHWLADAIDAARTQLHFALWAYVFMPEHVHLVVWPQRAEYDVAVILKEIKEPVGRKAIKYLKSKAPDWLPRVTVNHGRRKEHRFWQAGGGYDRNVIEPHTLFEMIEYIHANPVRRGLVRRAEDWKWSSAGWHEGKNPLRPDRVDTGGFTLYTGGYG